jgi:phospholipid/cholesterol/gamma-HCH transport system substrate-binding protein
MKKQTAGNIRLGLFVSLGTVILVVALYLIGSKRNIFSNTIHVSAQFYNVNGLMQGNNVRYAGIDIGTVDKIRIENDSSVNVYMVIEKKHSKYIRKNSLAAIGTDGLMGNKLVNINPGMGPSEPVVNGDVLQSLKPVETEEMVRTLNTTNDNLEAITGDLRKFTSKLNKDRGVLKLIEDSVSAENIRLALAAIRDAALNANRITLHLQEIAEGLNEGEGLAGVLLKDTVSANQLRTAVENIQLVSDSLTVVAGALSQFASGVNNPDGLAYVITSDTAVASEVRSGIKNLEEGTVLLNENLNAMRSNWLFRKYFKEEEDKRKKQKK